jgi:hypothetical protein
MAQGTAASRTAQTMSFDTVERLVDAAEKRDANYRSWVAVLRHLYRTGRLDLEAKGTDLDRPLWAGRIGEALGDDIRTVNHVCSYISVIVAATTGRVPGVVAEASFITDETQMAADNVSRLISMFLAADDIRGLAQRCGLDASVVGDGWAHVSWVHDEMSDDEVADRVETAKQEWLEVAAEAGLSEGDMPDDDEFVSLINRVRVSRPTARYVSPVDVILPGHIADVRETPWYAVRTIETLEDIKSNEAYDEEARNAVGADRNLDESARRVDLSGYGSTDEADEVAAVYHFYDVRRHTITVYTKHAGKPLYEGPNPNEFGDPCLVQLRAYRDGEHVRGFGDLELIAGLHDKLSEVVNEQLAATRKLGPLFFSRGGLTEKDVQAIETAEPYEVINLEGINPDTPLSEVLLAVNPPAIPADLFNIRGQLLDDMPRSLGLNDFQTGGVGADRMSGTAAAVVNDVASMRAQMRQDSYELFYGTIANLFFKLCKQHLTEEQVVSITGPDGRLYSEMVSLDDLSMDFFMRIETGSTSALPPSARAARGRQLLELAAQLPQLIAGMEQQGFDADPMIRMALRDMGYDPSILRRKPTPPAAPTAPGMPQMPTGPGTDPRAQVADMGGPPVLDGAMPPAV